MALLAPHVQGQTSREMAGLLALLLVMSLPWVETNVTVSGRQSKFQALGLLGWGEEVGWNACADSGVAVHVWTPPWPQVGLDSCSTEDSVGKRA